jgi:hypothetical protein
MQQRKDRSDCVLPIESCLMVPLPKVTMALLFLQQHPSECTSERVGKQGGRQASKRTREKEIFVCRSVKRKTYRRLVSSVQTLCLICRNTNLYESECMIRM